MDYTLAIENAPDTIPGGTGVLLLHPSIGETDRIDTDFLKTDTDHFLVISTRTTAREVEQKLEHYDVDESKADILDALSVERGYSRRASDRVHYVSTPEDLDGIVEQTRAFLESHEGKLRVSVDSVTEMAYYAGVDGAHDATGRRRRAVPPLEGGPRRRDGRSVPRPVRHRPRTRRRRANRTGRVSVDRTGQPAGSARSLRHRLRVVGVDAIALVTRTSTPGRRGREPRVPTPPRASRTSSPPTGPRTPGRTPRRLPCRARRTGPAVRDRV